MGDPRPKPSDASDLRRDRRREQRRLLWMVLAFLIVAGGLVIALSYGAPAAVIGLVCLVAGAGLVLLLWQILRVIEWLGKDR